TGRACAKSWRCLDGHNQLEFLDRDSGAEFLISAPCSHALLFHHGWHTSGRMQFNEGKACDAVLRHLEARERAERSNIRRPEEEHHVGPVELVCNVGSALYAFEHTG